MSVAPKLSKLARKVDYGKDYRGYIPSKEAIDYSNTNKAIYDGEFENITPVAHYQMFDTLYNLDDTCIVAARGIGKSTFVQNLFFYVALYGGIPAIPKIDFMIYVSDTVDNGCKTMTANMQYSYDTSPFLQKYLPKCKFNEGRWVLTNADGRSLIVRVYGAEGGIRGAREKNKRPQMAVVDDVLNDKNADSPAKLKAIRNTIFKAIKYAIHPTKSKLILIGTPFHDSCIVSQAVASGNFNNLILPICEKFPVSREEFRGVWEDRYPYEVVKALYSKAKNNSERLANESEDSDSDDGGLTLEGFYQEMQLIVNSSELKVIDVDKHIGKVYREDVLNNRDAYNFYITTDFATKDNQSGDLSFILVWAYDDNRDLVIVDGICGHNSMTTNVEELFRLVETYRPIQVGIETSGQQGGFVSWLKRDMITNDIFFNIVECPSTTNKLVRFNVIVPKIQAKKFYTVIEDEGTYYLDELKEELDGVTKRGFNSEFDDGIDTISQLQFLDLLRPYYIPTNDDSVDDIARIQQNNSNIYKLRQCNSPKVSSNPYMV